MKVASATAAGSAASFSARLLVWHAHHGRHDLPWQQERTPYRVWLSEIMLQQTQVVTVIPYFARFVTNYPTVAALAAAPLDDVLHWWSGLGYYSRARNLHRTAQLVMRNHQGEIPHTRAELEALPGIGRSTAAAILALAHGAPHAILDGNVKRVLARYHAIAGWANDRAAVQQLWTLSEQHLPTTAVCDYTQAIMDLGATVCTRSKPRCDACPLYDNCAARIADLIRACPGPRPRRILPRRTTCFLVIENETGAVLLERRPAHGIWGGLWCFPEMADETDLDERCAALGLGHARIRERLPAIAHTFTHFHLEIRPLRLTVMTSATQVREALALRWYSAADSTRIGLSAPVARLLHTLTNEPGGSP